MSLKKETKDYAVVRGRNGAAIEGLLSASGRRLPCRLGRSGIAAQKREGDGATPLARMRPLLVYYRADRLQRPRTRLPVRSIRPEDGWCDDANDRNYNRPVRLPYDAGCETMWRDDSLYDLCVVLDYNISRRSRNAGSAIFMHLMSEDRGPTEGCIALNERDLRFVLARAIPGDCIRVCR